MTIKDIAKKVMNHFKEKNFILLPSEYEEVFCKYAKQYNVIIDDCNKVSKYIKKLDDNYKIIAKNYNIKTLDDLVLFLINYLNRESISKEKELINNLFLYTKRSLDVISILPIYKSKRIAIKHLDFINLNLTTKEFEKLRSEWIDFLNNFDDSILKRGAIYAKIRSEDALEIIDALVKQIENPDFFILIDSLIYTLTPSYASYMKDEIEELKKTLKENPNIILSKSFNKKLKELTDKRIKLDKEELKEKILDLDKITEKVSLKIIRILKQTHSSSTAIKNITSEIKNCDNKGDIESIKEKLIKIADSIDKEINTFHSNLEEEEKEVNKLKEKIKYLEKKIEKLQKEIDSDYLTGVASKKKIIEFLSKQEANFKRYNTIYSVVFIDIDYFKKINDTYGHDAGDLILKNLGLILKRYSRKTDLIGRFGGEEFVAVLPNINKKDACKFTEKLRKIIENTKFMYQNIRVKVNISAGVADREEVDCEESLLKLADKRLYKAKEAGRNRVVCD